MEFSIVDMHIFDAVLGTVLCIRLEDISRFFQVMGICIVDPATKILILIMVFFQVAFYIMLFAKFYKLVFGFGKLPVIADIDAKLVSVFKQFFLLFLIRKYRSICLNNQTFETVYVFQRIV